MNRNETTITTTTDSPNDLFVAQDVCCCASDMEEEVDAEMTARLLVMKQQEDNVYYRDYFQDTAQETHDPLPKDCRTKMCEWCFQMMELCHYSRETVDLTISFVDRFLALTRLEGLSHFQLVAMTCFCLAVKVFEPLKIKVDDVVQLSHGQYSMAQVLDMERTLLQTLQWRLHGPPTKWSWAQHVLFVCGYWGSSREAKISATRCRRIQELTLFQTQVAVGDYVVWQREWRPSTIAMASLWNALQTVGTSREEVRTCVLRIQRYSQGVLDPLSPDVTHAKARLLCRVGGLAHLAECAPPLPEEMDENDKQAHDTLLHRRHKNYWNNNKSNNMNCNRDTALAISAAPWEWEMSEGASSSSPPPQNDVDENKKEWLLRQERQLRCANVDKLEVTRMNRKAAKTKHDQSSSSSSPNCVSRPPTTPTKMTAATSSKRKQPHMHQEDQYKPQRHFENDDVNDKTSNSLRSLWK